MPYKNDFMTLSENDKIYIELYKNKNVLWKEVESTIGEFCIKKPDGTLHIDTKSILKFGDDLLKVVISDENFNSFASIKMRGVVGKEIVPLIHRYTRQKMRIK